ncbi:MAG: methyltransferase domain-containing protein [Vicinamibacterales bacterium]
MASDARAAADSRLPALAAPAPGAAIRPSAEAAVRAFDAAARAFERVGRAFDAAAPDYDRATGGRLFHLQRAEAHRLLRLWLPARARVLEVGCGTGVDAVFLARHGHEVVACDPSSEMRRLTERRAREAGVVDRVRVLDCPSSCCWPGGDAQSAPFRRRPLELRRPQLRGLTRRARRARHPAPAPRRHGGARCARRGVPVGAALLHAHRPQSAGGPAARRPRAGGRRRGAHLVPSLDTLGRALGSDLVLSDVRGLAVVVPPPHLEPHWRRVPRAVEALAAAADRGVAWLPGLRTRGDHVLARWEKRRYGRG